MIINEHLIKIKNRKLKQIGEIYSIIDIHLANNERYLRTDDCSKNNRPKHQHMVLFTLSTEELPVKRS